MCVGDRICLYLNSEVIFGDLRYPVPLLGVLLMSIKASGSPAHPDSLFVVLPPKTTQETTFRGAEGPVESSGVGAGAGRKPTAIYKHSHRHRFACQLLEIILAPDAMERTSRCPTPTPGVVHVPPKPWSTSSLKFAYQRCVVIQVSYVNPSIDRLPPQLQARWMGGRLLSLHHGY